MRALFSVLLIAALAVPAVAAAQEAAGRVLLAIGEVEVHRGTERIAARHGAEIRAGDEIRTGAASNVQIRFSDSSIVALRPQTSFKVDEYEFRESDPKAQRSLFSLAVGGMRTLTGAIGRVSRESYRVRTATSTIGIRGTQYALLECSSSSCANPAGGFAPAGTYGAVTEGRIGVTNRSGERVFGADQFFYVSSPTTAAERLLAPPAFLRDPLEGRSRAKQPQQQAERGAAQPTASGQSAGTESASTLAQTGLGAGTGDSRVSSSVTSTTTEIIPSTASTTLFQPTTELSVAGPATVLQPTNTGTVFYRLVGSLGLPVACSAPPCGIVTSGNITLGVNFTLQQAAITANFVTDSGDIFNLSTPSSIGGFPVTVSNGQITFNSTMSRVNHPQNAFSFRCSACGTGGSVGFLDSMSVSGTISGSSAQLTLTGVDAAGSNSFSATLSQATLPNTDVAAFSLPLQSGAYASRSASFWGLTLDASRRLVSAGPGVGQPTVNVGSASNVIAGSAPAAGNLVWGAWTTSGAQITDVNYASFVTGAPGTFVVVPWVTGTAPDTLPPSLGVLNYAPVGAFVNNGFGTLNAGSLSVDFVNRTLGISLNATNTVSGMTFQMNGGTSFSPISGRFSAGFGSVTCSGSCLTGAPGGNYAGFLAGPNAEGAGVTFNAGFVTTGVVGSVGFKR